MKIFKIFDRQMPRKNAYIVSALMTKKNAQKSSNYSNSDIKDDKWPLWRKELILNLRYQLSTASIYLDYLTSN